MDDDRIWSFEEGLWVGDADRYRERVDEACLMVVPQPPFVMAGAQAIEAVASTPRWTKVALSERKVSRPQEGLIVIAYKAEVSKDDGEAYVAHCTSVLRRIEHEVWRVVQHQQTPQLVVQAKG